MIANFLQPSDWYNVARREVIQLGGRSLFTKERPSLRALLATAYPKYPWQPSAFILNDRVPKGSLTTPENQRAHLEKIGKKFLGINEVSLPHSLLLPSFSLSTI